MGAKILHLSDIHFNGASESETDPDALYRDALVDQVRASVAEGSFDAIFVTGDIANWGLEAEYQVAKHWLDALARIAGVDTTAIYVVPGNHDVDRSVSRSHGVLKLVQRSVIDEIDEAGRERALLAAMKDEAMGPALFRPLEAYNAFASGYNSEVGPEEHGRWVRSFALEEGYWLKIFGLNSVLFSSSKPAGSNDVPRNNLYVGPFQSTFRTQAHEIGVVLIHHPPEWLLDNDEQTQKMKDRARLQFMGHKHNRDVDRTLDYTRFGAGAVSPNRHEAGFEPGFNIVHLGVRNEGGTHKLEVSAEVWTWQANPGQFRLHQTRERENLWCTSYALPPIPLDAEPMTGVERAPPPAPDPGQAHGRDVQRFAALSTTSKRLIADSLGLLSEDEGRLPERYRYGNIFKRAIADNKLTELVNSIRLAEEH